MSPIFHSTANSSLLIHTNHELPKTKKRYNIYTSALIVGKDYPHPEGLDYVRRKWKEAIRNKDNCQLLDEKRTTTSLSLEDITKENERIIRKAVGKGRYVSLLLVKRLL